MSDYCVVHCGGDFGRRVVVESLPRDVVLNEAVLPATIVAAPPSQEEFYISPNPNSKGKKNGRNRYRNRPGCSDAQSDSGAACPGPQSSGSADSCGPEYAHDDSKHCCEHPEHDGNGHKESVSHETGGGASIADGAAMVHDASDEFVGPGVGEGEPEGI